VSKEDWLTFLWENTNSAYNPVHSEYLCLYAIMYIWMFIILLLSELIIYVAIPNHVGILSTQQCMPAKCKHAKLLMKQPKPSNLKYVPAKQSYPIRSTDLLHIKFLYINPQVHGRSPVTFKPHIHPINPPTSWHFTATSSTSQCLIARVLSILLHLLWSHPTVANKLMYTIFWCPKLCMPNVSL